MIRGASTAGTPKPAGITPNRPPSGHPLLRGHKFKRPDASEIESPAQRRRERQVTE